MPEPGSHQYDIKRARRRDEYENAGVPDQRADEATRQDLEREHPPRRPEDERAAGPLGERPAGAPGAQGRERDAEGGGIRLSSSTFVDHDFIPRHCSRDGDNTAPVLEWSQVPEGTAELALLCEDPDAPVGTFLHWMVTGIPPTTTRIGGGEMPAGVTEHRNGFGNRRWDGPQPPVGDDAHRYFFRIYAANQPLEIRARATPDELRSALEGKELARGTIVGLYQR